MAENMNGGMGPPGMAPPGMAPPGGGLPGGGEDIMQLLRSLPPDVLQALMQLIMEQGGVGGPPAPGMGGPPMDAPIPPSGNSPMEM